MRMKSGGEGFLTITPSLGKIGVPDQATVCPSVILILGVGFGLLVQERALDRKSGDYALILIS